MEVVFFFLFFPILFFCCFRFYQHYFLIKKLANLRFSEGYIYLLVLGENLQLTQNLQYNLHRSYNTNYIEHTIQLA